MFKQTAIEKAKLTVGTRNDPNISKKLMHRKPFTTLKDDAAISTAQSHKQ